MPDIIMRYFFLLYAFLFILPNAYATKRNTNGHLATQENARYTILLTGASFASADNGWFELACSKLNATPINRAVGGEAIANTANKMIEGTLYSFEELEKLDALVIMQVHNEDVFDESQLLPRYTDYSTPFDRSNYAAAYDYVIKRNIAECYALKDNPDSRYYGTKNGKPVAIVLCTDWHDARTIYNSSIRKLAKKWGFPLVEFDTYIGFSKNSLHPVTGQQTSLLYAHAGQTIDGIQYGWHPLRGKHQYIQQRMAAIFTDLITKILPVSQ